MKRILQMMALLSALLVLPAVCQSGRLSPDDQKEFDKAYTKWVNDTRKNDRDDIAKDVRKMQEIMARAGIPANVPYDRIASTGNAYPARSYARQLPPDDQKDFDKAYTKWVNDTRKNDQENIAKDVLKMQEVMARNNIPADVPFDQVASTGFVGAGRYEDRRYPPPATYARLSPEDQRDFDRYYSQWIDDSRRNDRDDAARDMEHMQDIMARNNIPSNVPYDQLATHGAYAGSGQPAYAQTVPGQTAYAQTRLSPDDQRDFDKAYSKWVNDSRKGDRDDLEKDTRKMQDIMARYNIPSNVPYDQIASHDTVPQY
jgi:hypothetical protein